MKDRKGLLGRLARVFGFVVVAGSLVIVGKKIVATDLWALSGVSIPLTFVLSLFAALAYAANSFLLSAAWRRLLSWFGENQVPAGVCHHIYARTQIARYLPGNVFHVANRHLLGRKARMRHTALAAATVCEIVGVLIAAGVIALLGVGARGNTSVWFSFLVLVSVLCFLLMAPFAINAFLRKLGLDRRLQLPHRGSWPAARSLFAVLLLYAAFFLNTGFIVVATRCVVAGVPTFKEALAVITVFALSWVAGFVTPGAPAGMGVREATMVVSLEPMLGDGLSLLVTFAFRLITTLGDLLFFLSSFVLRSPHKPPLTIS